MIRKFAIIAVLFFPFFSAAVNCSPALGKIFDYEVRTVILDNIFDDLAANLTEIQGDHNKLVEFLRGNNDFNKKLIKYLRKLDEFVELEKEVTEIFSKKSKTKKNKGEKKSLENQYELEASRILIIILKPAVINDIIYVLKRYEDYIELCSTQKESVDKAISFFILQLVNGLILNDAKNMKERVEIASIIQKKIINIKPTENSGLDSINFCLNEIRKKFKRDYGFAANFKGVLQKGLDEMKPVIKDDLASVSKDAMISWLGKAYGMNEELTLKIIERMKSCGILQEGDENYTLNIVLLAH